MYNNRKEHKGKTGEKMYVDILLFENFIINYIILNFTSRYSKLKTTRIKLAIAAFMGAIYIFIIFFPSVEIFFTLLMKIAVSVLMIIIAFTPDKFRVFFRLLGIFYIISFALGGAAFGLFYFMGKGNVINGAFYIKDFPVSLLITAFAVGYILLNYCWGFIQNRLMNDNFKYDVTIELGDKQVKFEGILDTGNSLKDPITNYPVIVVEYRVLSDILPPGISNIFTDDKRDMDLTKLYELENRDDWICRVRIIPFTSLGKRNGMLIGIRPDNVKLSNKENIVEIKDVIIGLYNNEISKHGEYRALLCPELLN